MDIAVQRCSDEVKQRQIPQKYIRRVQNKTAPALLRGGGRF